mmetsp:Transcript_10656/g.24960  ORF Transcript_10656/g.24960 Transcript_10656/m.24960 type:complete len:91 (-) Transcript_10656:1619-1891(-)
MVSSSLSAAMRASICVAVTSWTTMCVDLPAGLPYRCCLLPEVISHQKLLQVFIQTDLLTQLNTMHVAVGVHLEEVVQTLDSHLPLNHGQI